MSDPTPTSDSGPTPEEFDELLAQCLENYESHGPSGVDAVCAKNPAHAGKIRKRIAQLVAMGMLQAPKGAAPTQFPEKLGDFRLIRQLGGGGMGVVYLAVQEPLGREVALKLIRPDMLYFPGTHERFEREIETISRLQHPGIVPIYTVGEANGIPYFAMECVRGCGIDSALRRVAGKTLERLKGSDLAAVVRETAGIEPASGSSSSSSPTFQGTWIEACVRIVIQVAEALDHAHRAGVVHRDIKPSNVMLLPDGRAQLLDFGLAVAEGTHRLTSTGSQLGSIHYMSPEQARGEHRELQPRSDIYSLGVTLYEMLTLTQPFTGATAHDVSARIVEGNPLPPRLRNTELTWEVETVCLKAMDVEASRRYATALEFAEDLRAAIEHRPIRARRSGPWIVAKRFVKRRPGLASALAAGAIVFLGGPAALWYQERGARQRIEAKSLIAEKNFQRAIDAVDAMLTEVGAEHLRKVPHMEPVRRKLVERAVEFYGEFLAERSDDPEVRLRAARVRERVGKLYDDLGQLEEAEASTRLALDELAALEREGFTDPSFGVRYAQGKRNLAKVLALRGLASDAHAALQDANTRLASVALADGAAADVRLEYAECLFALGVLLLGSDTKAAEDTLNQSLPIVEELTRDDPKAKRAGELLGRIHNALGRARENRGAPLEEFAAGYREAARCYERVAAEHPDDPELRTLQAGALMNLGTVTFGDAKEGETTLRQAIELHRALTRDFPAIPLYRYELQRAIYNLALLIASVKERRAEAEDHYRESLDLARKLNADYPGEGRYESELARATDGFGMYERQRENFDAAITLGTSAVEIRRAILAKQQVKTTPSHDLGGALHNLAMAYTESQRPELAIPLLEEAIRCQKAALAVLPDHPTFRNFYRFHLFSLANAQLYVGDIESALDNVDVLATEFSTVPGALRNVAAAYARAGIALRERDPDRARKLEAAALEKLDAAIAAGFKDFAGIHFDRDYAPLATIEGFAEREKRVTEKK
jgi:eukaryotic-like serine/threonine-protein kinase